MRRIYSLHDLMEAEPSLKESMLRKISRSEDFHMVGFREGNKIYFYIDKLEKYFERREETRCQF